MRHLAIAACAVLLTAGAALGFGTATVIAPAAVLQGETFEIEIDLQDNDAMVSFHFDGIMATGGATPGPTGTNAYHYGNDCGWQIPYDFPIEVPPPTAFPVGPMGTIAADFTAQNGICFRMKIVAPAELGPIDIYVTSGIYTNVDFMDIYLQTPVTTVMVTPEPVSALLLLAGVAMSRRKRRA